MKIFRFGHAIRDSQQKEKRATTAQNEAADFDLAGTGGFLSVVKYAVYTVLGALNWRLFHITIPGAWGVAVACVAILSEAFAIYCWNKQTKSACAHRIALRFFAISFTTISFIHACASLYEISGAGKSIGRPLWVYSYFVAFPLIFSMMLAGVCVLYYTHWSTRISEDRAKAVVESERSRASLLTEKVELANQMEIERARLGFFQEQVLMEEEYVKTVEQLAQVKQRGEEAINSIADPEVKAQILAVLGRVKLESRSEFPDTASGKAWRH